MDLVQQYGIPVIVLTASIDAARRQIMISKRVVDYFVKRNLSEIEHVAHVVNRLWENCQMKVLVVDDSQLPNLSPKLAGQLPLSDPLPPAMARRR